MDPRFSKMARVGYLSFGFILIYALVLDSVFSIGHGGVISLPSFVALVLCATLALAARSHWFVKLPRLLAYLSYKHVFIIALVLRLAWVLSSNVAQTSDFLAYDNIARDVLNGEYILNKRRASGPSLFLALHYVVLGHIQLFPQISQAVLSALQVILVYGIAVRTTGNRDAGKLAALALALWPEHILYTNLLGSDTLNSTVILASVWLLSPAIERHSLRLLGGGICLGIAQWMRPTAPLFLVAGLLFLVLASASSREWRIRLKLPLAFFAGYMLLVLPIMVLNYNTIGVPSPSPAHILGENMVTGTNMETKGRFTMEDRLFLREEVERRVRRDGEDYVIFYNRVGVEIAFERIRKDPLRFLSMALTHKVSRLWAWPAGLSWSLETSRFKAIYLYVYGMAKVWQLLTLFVCGVVLFVKSRWKCPWDERQVYVWAALFTTAAHLLLEVQPRYHHMFLPFLAICLGESLLILKRQTKVSEKASI